MAKRDFGQVATNRMEVLESPLTILPAVQPIFTITIGGTGTLASPTMKLYKGTKDISSTGLSGSMSVNGRTITCKQITGLSAGDYAFYIYYTDGGVADSRFCRFSVPREGA
jgi:hypothetical protein